MSASLALERRGRAAWFVAFAVIAALAAWVLLAMEAEKRKPPVAAGPVLPNFAASVGEASLIVVTTKDATYRIARTAQGWALRDRGDYPVRRERLAQFTDGMAGLRYLRPMTRDPEKFERLGVADPSKGGSGVLVQVQNAEGALIANLILGILPRGLYARDPAKDQTWAVAGELPPLRDPAAWLEIAPLSLDKTRIAKVDLYPPSGPPYSIARENPQTGEFQLEAPYDRWLLTGASALAAAGASFAALQPLDVAPAPAIGGAPRARHIARTFDGLRLEGELYVDRGQRWLKLVARAEDPQNAAAVAEASAINARAAAWAYGLSELAYTDFAPPVETVARSPDPPAARETDPPPPPAAPPAP